MEYPIYSEYAKLAEDHRLIVAIVKGQIGVRLVDGEYTFSMVEINKRRREHIPPSERKYYSPIPNTVDSVRIVGGIAKYKVNYVMVRLHMDLTLDEVIEYFQRVRDVDNLECREIRFTPAFTSWSIPFHIENYKKMIRNRTNQKRMNAGLSIKRKEHYGRIVDPAKNEKRKLTANDALKAIGWI